MCISNWRLSTILIFALHACFLLAVCCQFASAQEVKEFTKEQIENAFTTYLANKIPPVRGDFETQEAYQKRLPKPIDQKRIYVFPVCQLPTGRAFGILWDKNYKYDMEKQCLTIFAGCRYNYIDDPRLAAIGIKQDTDFIGEGLPIILSTSDHDMGVREKQNVYGAKVMVTATSYISYILNIDNYKNIPDSIIERRVIENEFKEKTDKEIEKEAQDTLNDPRGIIEDDNQKMQEEDKRNKNYSDLSLFHFSLPMTTATAQALTAQNIETVFYVHLHSYQESISFGYGGHLATIDNPTEVFFTADVINATLVKIVIRSSKTKEILVQYDIPAGENKPPAAAEQQPWDK